MLNIAAEQMKSMSSDDKNELLGWIWYIWLNHVQDDNTKAEILKRFERGEINNMMYGIDMWVEEERKKNEAKGEHRKALEMAKKMLFKKRPIDEITEFTGLSREEIKEIEKKLS